jgi:hypothetical protein
MKNILMMILGVGLALGSAAAQPKLANGGKLVGGGTPAKVIVVRPAYSYHPYGFGYYNPFYSPFYGYNSFYYSPYGFQHMPSKLDLEIEQITNDYHHEIAEVRHDDTLSKAERKQKIRDLRHERQSNIIDAKKTYYEKRDRDTE